MRYNAVISGHFLDRPNRFIAHVETAAGVETVQLYMQDVTASIVRPVKELRGFTKVKLAPGETKSVTLTLKKADMGFYNDAGEYVRESGLYRIHVGGSSRDCLTAECVVNF